MEKKAKRNINRSPEENGKEGETLKEISMDCQKEREWKRLENKGRKRKAALKRNG